MQAMALKIVWTKRAEKGYDSIVEYLISNFSDLEVKKFVVQSNRFFYAIMRISGDFAKDK